jgi:hypothetical protein
VDFNVIDQLLIRHSAKEKWECNGTVHQLFIDFKKAYDSVTDTTYSVSIQNIQ